MFSSNCCFLTCIQVSQEAGQVIWYSHLFQNFPLFIVIHIVKGYGIVNKAEIDVFLEFSSFSHDPVNVGNLISGSSAFSKTILNIRKFTVHVLLKPGMKNFDHYFTSMWDECNCAVVWAFFGIGMKTDLFQSCGHCWVFQICWLRFYIHSNQIYQSLVKTTQNYYGNIFIQWLWKCIRLMIWRRKWQPTPVFLPGKSHGQRSLVGYSTWGLKELDMTDLYWTNSH